MRLLTWNVGHQTRVRNFPQEAARALAGLSPDVVVLNEYVYSADHQDFYSALTEHGLNHSLLSDPVDVIGLRRPMFKRIPRAVSRYWDWFGSATSSLLDGRTVVLGDFNAAGNATVLNRLTTTGWRLVTPEEGWSYRSRPGGESAIDHAMVSPSVRVHRAAYVLEAHGFSFAGTAGSYSDHAVLAVDLDT